MREVYPHGLVKSLSHSYPLYSSCQLATKKGVQIWASFTQATGIVVGLLDMAIAGSFANLTLLLFE